MLGRDGRVALVNPAAEQLLGYAQEDLLGQCSDDLVVERDRAAFGRARRRYFAEPWSSRRTFKVFVLDPLGRERELKAAPEPLAGSDGLWVSVWFEPIDAVGC